MPIRSDGNSTPVSSSEPELMGIVGHGIDAHTLSDRVEIDIARMDQRIPQIDRAMSAGFPVMIQRSAELIAASCRRRSRKASSSWIQ